MEDERFIKSFINKIKRRIDRRNLLRQLLIFLIVGAAFLAVCILCSFVRPFYYAELTGIIGIIIMLIAGIIYGLMHRESMKSAALYIDSFGLDERIVTAYENMVSNDQSEITMLQRHDAADMLHTHEKEIIEKDKKLARKSIPWIRLTALILLVAGSFALTFLPSKVREEAAEWHEAKEEIESIDDSLEELIEAIEDLEDLDNLSEEEIDKLNEMADALQASRLEMDKAGSRYELDKAKDKLSLKLEDIQQEMDKLEAMGNSGSSKELKDISDMMNNLKQSDMMKTEKGSGQDKADNSSGQNGDGQNQNGDGQNQNGDGQNQNGSQNMNGDSNGQGSNGSGDGNQNSGDDSENGNGNDSGNGNGEGQPSGGDSSNGTGGGNGGNDAGTGPGSKNPNDYSSDYVSVDQNITGKYSDNSTSQYSHEQNGMVWEGEKVPYSTVIGDYQNSAYEGIEQGKYPDSMSEVIKNYFGGLAN